RITRQGDDSRRPVSKRSARPALLLTLVGGFFLHCSERLGGTGQLGERAPGFSLVDLDGHRVRLEDFTERGPVLLNFWATWCAPCKAEIPLLNEVHTKFSGRLTIVGISVEEARETVVAFRKKHELRYPVLLDPEAEVAKRYDLIGFPTNLVLDGRAKILFRQTRALDESAFDLLTDLLRRAGSGSK